MDNKEKYAGLISRSPLFSLDKEKDANAYKRESLKMVEYLYCYLMAVNSDKYEEYALEITNTAERCINNYRPESGEFLIYFLSAMKVEYRRAYAKNVASQMRGGMHIADDDERNLRKLCRYLEQKGIDHPDEAQIKTIAEFLDMPVNKVIDLLRMNQDTVIVSEYTNNDDGEEISVFDTIAADCEDEPNGNISIEDLLCRIETQYEELQERTKPLVSAALTVRMCSIICQSKIEVKKYRFIDESIVKEYITKRNLPTQRDIANRFGKNEASLSRTMKDFLEKLKLSIN